MSAHCLLGAANAPTQQEIFNSISHSMNTSGDSGIVLVAIGGVLTVVVAIAMYAQRRRNAPASLTNGRQKAAPAYAPPAPVASLPVPAKNARKLMKEAAMELGLSRQQLAKLKKEAKKRGIENPLTLLLCPSLIGQDQLSGRDAA